MRIARYRRLGSALALLLIGTAGCASAPATGETQLAPTMVIERFLRAANSNDLDTMARLFGTRDGTLERSTPRKELDERMFVIASVLRHSDYQIMAEQIVPGRRAEATQFGVQLTMGERRYEVPFLLVQSKKNGWLIEHIDLLKLTNRAGGLR